MTDTTAPRTAAPDLAAKRDALAGRWVGPGLTPMTEFEMAGAVFRDSLVVGLDVFGNIDAYDRRGLLNLVAELLDRAEAIEPLLALVRALEAAKLPHLVVDGDCWYSCGLAVDPYDGEPACCNDEERGKRCTCGADRHNAAIDEAIAALPESVRVAARKPAL